MKNTSTSSRDNTIRATRHVLVNTYYPHPDVKLSRPDAFGDSEGVDERSDDVEDGHEDEPAERGEVHRVVEAVGADVVHHGNHAAEAERDEHTWRRTLGIFIIIDNAITWPTSACCTQCIKAQLE